MISAIGIRSSRSSRAARLNVSHCFGSIFVPCPFAIGYVPSSFERFKRGLARVHLAVTAFRRAEVAWRNVAGLDDQLLQHDCRVYHPELQRSEEHTSELQSQS